LVDVAAHDADALSLNAGIEQRRVIGYVAHGCGAVETVAAGGDLQGNGRVAHTARERANLVKAAGKGHGTVARNPPVAWFQADHAAEACGQADAAAGVRAEADKGRARGHTGGRSP